MTTTQRTGYHWEHLEPGNKADKVTFNALTDAERDAVKHRVCDLFDANNGRTVAANWKIALGAST